MRSHIRFAILSTAAITLLAACSGDDNVIPVPTSDAGGDAKASADATSPDAGTADAGEDGGADAGDAATADASEDGGADSGTDATATDASEAGSADAGDSGAAQTGDAAADAGDGAVADAGADASAPPILLVTYTPDYSTSEYIAFDTSTGSVAGTFSYAQGGTNVTSSAVVDVVAPSAGTSPWVLEEQNDVVVKMSATAPGEAVSSWSVAEPTDASGYFADANPYAVAEVGTKAYVALYNRNDIAVLDTSQTVDGGVPQTTIDLSSLVQAGGDGNVETTALAYDATRHRVWAVLANLNEGGDFLACTAGLTSEVVAIDTTTDELVAGAVYPLTGYDPSSVTYDVAGDRLIVMSSGCNAALGDGGEGALSGANVEQIALATGQSTVLLDTTAQTGGYLVPPGLVYVDAHRAFLLFGDGSAYAWDPTTTALGAPIPNAPDTFTWDGRGLLGPKQETNADGGLGPIDAIEVDPTSGAVTTLGTIPVSATGGYWEGVGVWPRP